MILFKIQMIKLTFLSVELQQNNDELSISNFFFYLEVLEIKYE